MIDFAALLPSDHGAQNDLNNTPASFTPLGPVIPLQVFIDVATGARFFASPMELAAGRLGLHPWLLARA